MKAIGLIAVSKTIQAQGVSLDEQKRAIQERCQRDGWLLDELVTFPGVSRSQSDFLEFFTDNKPQHEPYRRLRDLIKSGAYHILISYDNGRIARSTTLFTYLATIAIEAGMQVVTIMSGTISEENADFAIPLAAMNASGEVKRRVKMTEAALDRNIERGLHTKHPPASHRVIRDERGKPLRLELREDICQMMNHAADLLLEGWGWRYFPRLMHERYGYLNPRTGKWYPANFFRRFFYNPYTWGYAARHFLNKYGRWAYDESAPLPDGVVVNRQPHPPIPPVWTGKQAELIQAELTRRATVIKGHASPRGKHKFTGLLICGECGYVMAAHEYRTGKQHKGPVVQTHWRCSTVQRNKSEPHPCSQRRQLPDKLAILQVDMMLREMISRQTWDIDTLYPRLDDNHEQRAETQRQIADVENQINTMIIQQSRAPESVQNYYQNLIAEHAERLTALRDTLARLQAQTESSSSTQSRQRTFAEIVELGLARFWEQEPRAINQFLHRLMGKRRLVVLNGAIVRIT